MSAFSPDDDAAPDWVRAALRQTKDELALFVRTLLAFTVHPRRFTRLWIAGEQEALNPFGFVATAVGVLGFVKTVSNAVDAGQHDPGDTFAAQVLSSVLPPVYFALLGLFAHGVLRVAGSRRRLRSTLAIALYAAGPALAAEIVLALVADTYAWRKHEEINGNSFVVWPLVVFAFLAFAVPFVGALRELHARSGGRNVASWLRSVCAFTVALAASGVLFGALDPPGSYGLHPVLGMRRGPHGFDAEYGLRD